MKIKGNIIAHRGVHDNIKIPENSMKAFKKALDLDYPIELDVQLTKDNKLVVFHDFNLRRMTNETDFIQDMNYADIIKVNLLDTHEKIPMFEDVLKLIKGKVLLDIEIKNTDRIKETCDELVRELDGYDNCIVKSFNPRIVKYLKDKYPELEVGLLITNDNSNKIYDMILTSNFILKYCRPDFLAISKKLLEKKRFKELSKKIPTLIWTIKKESEIDSNSNLIYICNNLPFARK